MPVPPVIEQVHGNDLLAEPDKAETNQAPGLNI